MDFTLKIFQNVSAAYFLVRNVNLFPGASGLGNLTALIFAKQPISNRLRCTAAYFHIFRQLEFYCINSHSDCRKEHWRWKFGKLSANFIIFRKRGENDNYYLIQKHSKKIFLPFKSCHSLLNVYNLFECFQIIQMPFFFTNYV